MQYSTAVLGRGTVARLQVRAAAPILTIGRDTYTRASLADVECFNFVAAARLSAAIRALKVKDTRDLYHHVEPEQLALPGIGSICLAVLGACFERAKVGTLDDWVERTRQKNEPVTTFATIKTQIARTTTTATRTPRRRRGTS
jgi:hypothetical protein